VVQAVQVVRQVIQVQREEVLIKEIQAAQLVTVTILD
jgi:hypothetical protein